MMRLLICLAPLTLATGVATAQDHGHHRPPAEPAQAPAADPQARPTPDPHADHREEARPEAVDPHAGHVMPAQADPHAGHDMGAHAKGPPDVPTSADDPGRPPLPPPPPAALSGPAHAADAIWGEAAMSRARETLRRENGDIRTTAIVVDRLEAGFGDGVRSWVWDVGGWTGGDIHRLWWKSEGGGEFGGRAGGEAQALYSRAVRPFWDFQAGVRQDFGRGGHATHLALGMQGLAPYWFEVDAALFLSTRGDLTARVEAEYDQRITQRLILQPRVEVEASASDVPERHLGAGLTHIETGLRLRYEIVREFAPYVGVEWSRDIGRTARFSRARGEDDGGLRWLVGIKAWF